jgi:hypothetical protein
MLFEIEGMLTLREQLINSQTLEGGWEQSYKRSRTPIWKMKIEVWLFARTSWLLLLWVARRPLRLLLMILQQFIWVARRPLRLLLMILQQFILLTKCEFLSTVFLLPQDLLLHRRIHHSYPSWLQRTDTIRISLTPSRWRFCDWVSYYSTSIDL